MRSQEEMLAIILKKAKQEEHILSLIHIYLLCGAVSGVQPDYPREALAEMRGGRRHHYRHRVRRRLYCEPMAPDGRLGLFLSSSEPVRPGMPAVYLFMGSSVHSGGLFGSSDGKTLSLVSSGRIHTKRVRRL